MKNIFNVLSPTQIDESIKNYSYRTIYSFNNNQFNTNDEVRYIVMDKNLFIHPHESQLVIDLEIIRPKKKAPTDETVRVGMSEFGIAHLFSKLAFYINGQKIDEVNNVGLTTALKSAASLSFSEKAKYSNLLFHNNTYDLEKVTMCLPLKLLSGFFEDYKRVLFNCQLDLVLLRSQSNKNCLDSAVDGADIKITNMVWQVPFVEPNDQLRLEMMKIIKNDTLVTIPFRNWGLYTYPTLPKTKAMTWPIRTVSSMERPRFIIVGFQTNRENQAAKDNGEFDNCDIKNVTAYLGSERYPYINYNCDFARHSYATLYAEYVKFQEKYYGRRHSEPMYDIKAFKDNYSIWCIDTMHQAEVASSSNMDIKLEIESDTNFPDETSCHCLIISDRVFEYSPFSGIVKQIL